MEKINRKMKTRTLFMGSLFLGILFLFLSFLLNSYSLMETEPISNISYMTEKLSYETKEAGSFKVTKSAKWVSRRKAKVTIDIDTIPMSRNAKKDIIFVVDVSKSMKQENLENIQKGILSLSNTILSDPNNRIALITYDSEATTILDFTNNQQLVVQGMNMLSSSPKDVRNNYQAFINVDQILEDYQFQKNQDLIVCVISSSFPNSQIPNEVGEYQYLKSKYPNINIFGFQYELGEESLAPIERMSDRVYLVKKENFESTLFSVCNFNEEYQEFLLKDEIDENYFDSIMNPKVTEGKVEIQENEILWDLSKVRSGEKIQLSFDIMLKDLEGIELFSTNKRQSIKYQIKGLEETIENRETPILKNKYEVIYEGNAPSDCNVGGIPESELREVYEGVEVSSKIPSCEGYQFQGWKHVTKGVTQITENQFLMSESNVILRATWTSMKVKKALNGSVVSFVKPVLQNTPYDEDAENTYTGEFWAYKEQVKKIVIQDYMKQIPNAIKVFDISEEKNGGVLAYTVQENGGYTIYIQGDGVIEANKDSSYLFAGFKNLETIEGLENLDTSQVTNMSFMFWDCNSITSLNVSSFDTSKVTDMSCLFDSCGLLTDLDVSHFDTSNVINMYGMFSCCYALTGLDLSNFDTRNVTNMSWMFNQCQALTSLNISTFSTSKVTDMGGMFHMCEKLTNLDLSSFNTSNVTDMNNMFNDCVSLMNLDLRHFDTANVTDMNCMFLLCSTLTNLDLSNFDTRNVTSMAWMFNGCSSLTSLNVSHFDTGNVTDMSGMFQKMPKLKQLDVSSFDTSNVTSMIYMFHDSGYTSLNLSNFNTSKVEDMVGMFQSCAALTSLNLSSFDTSRVTNFSKMFQSTSSLGTLNLANFSFESATSIAAMFYNAKFVNTTINIRHVVTDYEKMFYNAATNGKIVVNYTSETSSFVNSIIATKSKTSKVAKGSLLT